MDNLYCQAVSRCCHCLLWDGSDDWRKEIYPEYKGNRLDPEKQAIKEAYKEQIPFIQSIVDLMGIPQVYCPTSEADDLAGFITKGMNDWNIIMVTKDTDWLQAVRENVVWHSLATGDRFGLDDFDKVKDGPFSGPEQYILCKAMSGDSSDNIVGIQGIGPRTARKILEDFGDLDGLCDAVEREDKSASGKRVQEIYSSMDVIYRNQLLMDWRFSMPMSMEARVWQGYFEDPSLMKELGQDELIDRLRFFSANAMLNERAMKDIGKIIKENQGEEASMKTVLS